MTRRQLCFRVLAGASGLTMLALLVAAVLVLTGAWSLGHSHRVWLLIIAVMASSLTALAALFAYELNRHGPARGDSLVVADGGVLHTLTTPSDSAAGTSKAAADGHKLEPSITSEAFWSRFLERHWRAALVTGFSLAVTCFAPWLQQEWQRKAKQTEQMQATAQAWSKMRSAIIEYAAQCPAPGETCAKIRQRASDAYSEASYVIPPLIREIGASCPHTDSAADACSGQLDALREQQCVYRNACELLRGPAAMAKASHSFRAFVAASARESTVDLVAADHLRDAVKQFLVETRVLGCAILFARAYQVREEDELEPLASCRCRNLLLGKAIERTHKPDDCRSTDYGMDADGNEQVPIEDLMAQRCTDACLTRGRQRPACEQTCGVAKQPQTRQLAGHIQ